MGLSHNDRIKHDDELISDYNTINTLEQREIEEELIHRGYEQHDNQWVHETETEDDGNPFSGAVLIFLGIILLIASFYITIYVHFSLNYIYLYSTYSFIAYAILLVLIFIKKENAFIKLLYCLATFAAVVSSYPHVILAIEKEPSYVDYFYGDTGFFPLVFYAFGFFVYVYLITRFLYNGSIFAVTSLNKYKKSQKDSDVQT